MRITFALLIVLALAACSSRQALFVVLPNPDGTAGAITVDDGKSKVALDHAYAAGEVSRGEAKPVAIDQPQVQQIFGTAINARPTLPSHFRLYFVSGGDTLTPEGEHLYQEVFADIKNRPVYEIEVIGHTDSVGNKTYNQQLSLQRARALRDRLIHDGIAAATITVAGRGQLDLAVKTDDQVADARNRRVEITVR